MYIWVELYWSACNPVLLNRYLRKVFFLFAVVSSRLCCWPSTGFRRWLSQVQGVWSGCSRLTVRSVARAYLSRGLVRSLDFDLPSSACLQAKDTDCQPKTPQGILLPLLSLLTLLCLTFRKVRRQREAAGG